MRSSWVITTWLRLILESVVVVTIMTWSDSRRPNDKFTDEYAQLVQLVNISYRKDNRLATHQLNVHAKGGFQINPARSEWMGHSQRLET